MCSSYPYLGTGQSAHDKVLVLEAIIIFLVIAGSFCSAGPLETSKGSPTGLRVKGVHYNGLCAFNLTAAKRAALTLWLLKNTHSKQSFKFESRVKVFVRYDETLTFAQPQITAEMSPTQTTNEHQLKGEAIKVMMKTAGYSILIPLVLPHVSCYTSIDIV